MTGGSSGSFQNGKIYEDNPSCNAHLLFNSVILSAAKDPGNAGTITGVWRHSLDASLRGYERAHLLRVHHVEQLGHALHRYEKQRLSSGTAAQEWRDRRIHEKVSLQSAGPLRELRDRK